MFGAMCVILILGAAVLDIFSGDGGRAGGAIVILILIWCFCSSMANKEKKHDDEMFQLYKETYPGWPEEMVRNKMLQDREYQQQKMREQEQRLRNR